MEENICNTCLEEIERPMEFKIYDYELGLLMILCIIIGALFMLI